MSITNEREETTMNNKTMYALKDTDTKDICYFTEFDLETLAWIKRHYVEMDSGVVLFRVDDHNGLHGADPELVKKLDALMIALFALCNS